jgi:hypothetical protein
MPKWRKATWALVIWNALIMVWAVAAIVANLAVNFQLAVWLVGSIVLGLVWLMSRSRFNTLVYGPRGQQRTVTAKDAKRRVEGFAWSYTPIVVRPQVPQEAGRR